MPIRSTADTSNPNLSDQLSLFPELRDQTSSLSDHLVKILVWLETEPDLMEKGVLLSAIPSHLLSDTGLTFLSGKMLRERSPQTLAKIFGRLSKPLPTLGVIDCTGNCLIRHGFYPKVESEFTLSEFLEEEVDQKYFLSEEKISKMQRLDARKRAMGQGFGVLLLDMDNGWLMRRISELGEHTLMEEDSER